MTIGMLLNAPYPSDVRVKKETDALLKAGFKVHLLCLRKSGENVSEVINGLHIERIDAGKNNIQLALWDVIMSITFVHPVFKKAIPGWVKKNGIDVFHVHDLPLVGTALAIRKASGIPVIADFHENYPEALRAWFEWKRNPIARLKNKIFMNADRWTTLEKRAALESDRVIAVVDEMKQRLITSHQVNPKKVTVVSNTEDRSFLQQPDDPSIYRNFSGKFIITYSGNIGPHRGVDTAIKAMGFLKAYPDIQLVIIGSGSTAVMNFLDQLSKEHTDKNQVHFLGRQPFEKFFSFMCYTSANLIPHKSNDHTDNTVPHKLFQAMMAGKPVIVSTSAPLNRIISQTQAGIIFKADDEKDLADKILHLYQHPELQKQMGDNGIRATI
ncbi:MAG TPA: glycosyltransferase family 4 protein, partial [Ohtaekwangia sp.]